MRIDFVLNKFFLLTNMLFFHFLTLYYIFSVVHVYLFLILRCLFSYTKKQIN